MCYDPNQDYAWHEQGWEAHLVIEHPPVHEGASQYPPLPHPYADAEVSVNVLDIIDVSENRKSVELKFVLYLQWKDLRLTFKNLQPDSNSNLLTASLHTTYYGFQSSHLPILMQMKKQSWMKRLE